MLVATFLTGSSSVLTAIVLSGFSPPSATPGMTCGAPRNPPPVPDPGDPGPSRIVPFMSTKESAGIRCISGSSTGPLLHVWPRPDVSLIRW
jgi:hypothetical protein